MPAIKKKWMKTNQEEGDLLEEDSGKNESVVEAEGEKEVLNPDGNKEVKKPVTGKMMLKKLDGEVLIEKRKRFTPPAELKLSEWLDNNLEKRTEGKISPFLLYKYYTRLCQTDGSEIIHLSDFNKMVKVKFGTTFGVQASSVYKKLIKEYKMGDKKKASGGIKLKEILKEAINYYGNPWHGIRYFNILSFVRTKYPVLRIDNKPKLLRRHLEMGTNYGYIVLVKGIGKAGCYRLPGAVKDPPKPKSKTKKGEEVEDEDKEKEKGDESEKEGNADDEKEANTDGADEEKEAANDEETTKPKKAKKKPTFRYSGISYSNPARIEDTFPLAITYQSAPKATGLPRIRRYILDKYMEEITDHRWRKTVESGVEKGLWEHISGSGITGKIHLLMDDFDPASEQLEDRICAAIIACHDPKTASASQIKKYVMRYHTEFGVDQRPDRFKKALLKAVDKKMIRQVSGIGAIGSFQLLVPFTPSPTVLAGEDDSDEEGGSDGRGEETVYTPIGTKSRGLPKPKKAAAVEPKKSKKVAAAFRRGRGKKSANTSEDEEDEEVVFKTGKGKRHSSPSKGNNISKKGRKRSFSPLTDEEEEEVEEEPEYLPQKSQSRGGAARKQASSVKAKAGKGKAAAKKKSSVKSSPKANKRSRKDSVEEDNEEVEEYTPRKSSSRGGESPAKSSLNGTPKKRGSSAKPTPAKSPKTSGIDEDESPKPATPAKSPKKRGAGNEVDSTPKPTPTKRAKAGRSAKKNR